MTHRIRRVAVVSGACPLTTASAFAAADPVPDSRYAGQTSQTGDLRFEFRTSADGSNAEKLFTQFRAKKVRAGRERHAGQHPRRLDRDHRRRLPGSSGKEKAKLKGDRLVRGAEPQIERYSIRGHFKSGEPPRARSSVKSHGPRTRPAYVIDTCTSGQEHAGVVGRPPRRRARQHLGVASAGVSPRLPEGAAAPPDGALPAAALACSGGGRSASTCTCRTARPLRLLRLQHLRPRRRRAPATASPPRSLAELRAGRARVLGDARRPPTTVFFGGGTPTLLDPAELARDARRDRRSGSPGAEVTIEANPETRRPGRARRAARGRVHPHLARHAERRPARARDARAPPHARPRGRGGARGARRRLRAGQPRPDLRHARRERRRLGAPRWRRRSAPGPTTSRAYALIVEPGTRLAAQVRRGELPAPDDDVLAERYGLADAALGAAGLRWYEISNWAASRRPAAATTSATGAAATGGAPGPARTATSAACAGGTSCTPPAGRPRWPPARSPARRPRAAAARDDAAGDVDGPDRADLLALATRVRAMFGVGPGRNRRGAGSRRRAATSSRELNGLVAGSRRRRR